MILSAMTSIALFSVAQNPDAQTEIENQLYLSVKCHAFTSALSRFQIEDEYQMVLARNIAAYWQQESYTLGEKAGYSSDDVDNIGRQQYQYLQFKPYMQEVRDCIKLTPDSISRGWKH